MTSEKSTDRAARPVAWLLALLLAGCGGGSGGPGLTEPAATPPPDAGSCSSDCGTLMLAITDADGDFASYLVTVTQLSLERRDGVVVDTLPAETPIDFARYTQLTEFVTAASVPPGTYVAAEITLDYAQAEVLVERDGEGVAAEVAGPDGTPLGVASFRIQLADARQLTIRPGLPSVMTVDFDLAASHEVDLDVTPVAVTAEPFLLADVEPLETKEIRVRGPLASVDVDDASYVVALRPFWLWRGDFGRLRVHTNAETAFEIDGVSYRGDAGIAVMSELPQASATIAFGTLEVAARRFEARQVYAGSSVPGHDADVARGVVIAREGDVISLRGATLVREQGDILRQRQIDVQLGPETVVRKAGDADFDGDISAISIGQRLTAFGRIDAESRILDATGGRVRLLPTVVTGIANDISAGQIVVDVQRLGGHRVGLFDFTGTGLPGLDADPANYEVDTTPLDLTGVDIGAPVKASGFVNPFGLAPPDFRARTVAQFSEAPSGLSLNWNPPSGAPFLMLGPEGITLDLGNPDIGRYHYVRRGGIFSDLLELDSALLVPASDRPTSFAIREFGDSRMYSDFARFTDDLAASLGAGASVAALHASGRWSDSTGQLTAARIVVRLR